MVLESGVLELILILDRGRVNMIKSLSREHGKLTPSVMCALYSSMVLPIIEYGSEGIGDLWYLPVSITSL